MGDLCISGGCWIARVKHKSHFYGTHSSQNFYIDWNIQVLTVCTVQINHCMTFTRAIESRADGFRIALVVLWCHTIIGVQIRFKLNERTNTPNACVFALISSFSVDLTFSCATIGRLCTIAACYWSNFFGCFRRYKNHGQDMSHINGIYGHPMDCKYWFSLSVDHCWASVS